MIRLSRYLERIAPTGEQFLMREPQRDFMFIDDNRRALSFRAHGMWQALQAVLEHSGAQVHTLQPTKWRLGGERSAMYVRDVGFMVRPDGQSICVLADGNHKLLRQEAGPVQGALDALGVGHVPIHGSAEGGNLVSDPSRNVLYWGVNNRNHMRELLMKGHDFHPFWRAFEYRPHAERVNRLKRAKPSAEALMRANDVLTTAPQMQQDGNPMRILPMFTKDEHAVEFYHLDGALGVLPGGQMVACTPVLSRVSQRVLEASGADIYPLSIEEARDGATNIITVGNRIITPSAPSGLKRFYEEHGYEVIDPRSVGLSEGSWQFGPMAGPRCATLKLTPDHGFPQPMQGRAASARTGP